jgi:uncharacterized protein YukE
MTDWTTMAKQVIVDGRPADVTSAGLDWDVLLQKMCEVKQSLDQNVNDLAAFWKGQAYDDFKTHIQLIAKNLQRLIDEAKAQHGIANALKDAAKKLAEAQAMMPVPAECIGDILAARKGQVTIGPGFLEAHLRASFYNSWLMKPVEGLVDDFRSVLSDVEEKAQQAYDKVNKDYRDVSEHTPNSVDTGTHDTTNVSAPNLTDGGPGTVPRGVPHLDGNGPLSKTPTDSPSHGGLGQDPWGYGTGDGSFSPPESSLAGTGDGSFSPPESSLAGAGGGPVGAGVGGLGGLGDLAGVGAGAGGAGAGGLARGGIPGGGSLGMPVSGGALGARGGSGRGGRTGTGRGGARGGMMGGHGSHGGGDDEGNERTTWLQEDEDPWGADNDAPPSVLT